jgi:tetratricopeptide (TPR) repeat protein
MSRLTALPRLPRPLRWLTLGLLAALALPAQAAWLPPLPQHARYGEAASHLAAGELGEAEAGFRAVLAEDPDCGMAQHGLGVAMLRQGRLEQAVAQLQGVTRAWPQRAEGHTALSVAHFARQDFTAARQSAQAAVAAAPADTDANAALVEVLLRQGALDEARALVTRARAAGLPSGTLACLDVQVAAEAGDRALARSALFACLRGGSSELVMAVRARAGEGGAAAQAGAAGARELVAVAQAVDLMRDGETAEAAAILDEVLGRSPGRTDARLLRARARAAQGQRAAAREDLEQAFSGKTWVDVHASGAMSGILRMSDERALQREVARGAALLVDLLREEGQLTEARARLGDFRERWPAAAPLVVAEALLLETEGKTDEAWALLDSALAASPDDSTIVLQAAARLALRAPEEVPPRLQARIATAGDWRDRYNLAVAERKAGRTSACRDIAVETLAGAAAPTRPEDGVRVAALAHRCGVEAGDLSTADAQLAAAGGRESLSPVLAYNHALLRQQAGDPAGAWSLVGPHALSPPGDAAAAQAMTSLGLRLAVDLGELDSGLAVARAEASPPKERVRLVKPLLEAGRIADALGVLDAACPALDGDQGERCRSLQAELRGAEPAP